MMSYRDRLLTLKLLSLTFDCELKDLVSFYKCLNGLSDLKVSDFVSFVSYGRTRLKVILITLKLLHVKLALFRPLTLIILLSSETISVNFHPLLSRCM